MSEVTESNTAAIDSEKSNDATQGGGKIQALNQANAS